ncbi:MAG TPA: GNAT family N-acetyltransferase [Actinoplanes sp.]|nr:GNAT family N-acetyltransferase [Actinoplanes sp.]
MAGQGVASALKRATLAWAAAQGIREVYTWTQTGNADMRRLNEHLGYVTRLQSFTMRAPL